MTLPTGVSTFLLDCLESDSTAEYNTGANSSLSSCPSPETFRDDASERSPFYLEEPGKYKNSTLLDCSKAVAIDKLPQISNLSAILDPVGEDFQGQHTRRKRPPNYNYTSSELSVSTTLAGKKVCKITAARERTPDLNSGMSCSSPLGPESKQTAKAQRLKAKEKENNSNALEEGRSSLSQLGTTRTTSAQPEGLTAEVLPASQPERLGPLCGRQEICSIVRTSPTQRSSRLHQIPVRTREFQLPKREPEDNITSTKNWICCKHK
ncbi:MEIKN protein, partial [Bucco capensis]|nr:MEIKN protein [Bucco capensis]